MTRKSFLCFNLLLVAAIYGLVYITGSKSQAISYTMIYFSAPYVALNVVMALLLLLRSFMRHDEDVVAAKSYMYAALLTLLATFLAVEIVSGEWRGGFAAVTHLLR